MGKRFFLVVTALLLSVLLLGFSKGEESSDIDIFNYNPTESERESIIQELEGMLEDVEQLDSKEIPFELELNVTNEGEKGVPDFVNLPTQAATKEIGTAVDEDGDEVTLYASILSGSLTSSSTGSDYRDYGHRITQNHYLEWYRKHSNNQWYQRLHYQRGNWNRTTSAFTVRNVEFYHGQQGRTETGSFYTCTRDYWNISSISFSGNNSQTYARYLPCNTFSEENASNNASRLTSDIYYNGRLVRSGFRNFVRPY
ncbi:hypothetical protein [Evansella clarkii]|uniref:hypothetical protein n=1 Tax=Evansella clarkii TaxID=79879 RepID=UPI000998DADE|nr:hypothetical protein [Evansella clarkii]